MISLDNAKLAYRDLCRYGNLAAAARLLRGIQRREVSLGLGDTDWAVQCALEARGGSYTTANGDRACFRVAP